MKKKLTDKEFAVDLSSKQLRKMAKSGMTIGEFKKRYKISKK